MSIIRTPLLKSDDELQIVYGEVYAPDVPDSDGDFMTTETIRKAAHNFLKNQRTHQVDKQHDNDITGAYVVESFIARKDDPVFIDGSWVVGVHVPDVVLWNSIKKGELNGFTLEATAKGVDATLSLDIPPELTGLTNNVEGHTHTFYVSFNSEGVFLGGHTSDDEGHYHTITSGTQTNTAANHAHLFSFVEDL